MGYFRTWDLTDEQLENHREYLVKMLHTNPDGIWNVMLPVIETEQKFRANPGAQTDHMRHVAWHDYLDVVRKEPHPTQYGDHSS